MDEIQRKHERAVGEAFVDWYNSERGTKFDFDGRPHEAPDLLYRHGNEALQIEVGQAYYDERDAAFKWKGARGDPNAPKDWHGVNFNDALIQHVGKIIVDKCTKRYGSNCVLVVNVYPDASTIDEINARFGEVEIPRSHPFAGIYLTGHFSKDILHPSRPSGYRCWKLA